MTDTKNPIKPTTGCALLGRPLAEVVSLEVVWAAAYAAYYMDCGYATSARDAAEAAQEAVDDLLAAHPRGGA